MRTNETLSAGASPGPIYVVEGFTKGAAIVGIDQLLGSGSAVGTCRTCAEDYHDLALRNDTADD